MAVNKFSDLLNTEFVAQMNGLRVDMDKVRSRRQRRLYCTVLYCTVLYCTVLYCTVLYCTVYPAP